MPTFTDAAEAEKYLSAVFEAGFADPDISPALQKSGLILRMDLSDPDTVVTADLVAQKIYIGHDAPEANMTLALSSEVANRFWQGKVSVPLAVARGTIKLSGALPKLIAMLPAAKPVQASYIERLKADGRDDLLA